MSCGSTPVVPEAVNLVAFAVIGADVTVIMAAEGGQLQLNPFEPIICHSLLHSMAWLTRCLDSLRVHCVDGIEVNREDLVATTARSVGVATALLPTLGDARASQIAAAALAGQGDVRSLSLASGSMDADELDHTLQLDRITGLQH